MLAPYREVLSHPGALAFSAAGALARVPMSMVGIGIVLMVSEIYGSYGLAGRISAVQVITHAICSPLLSRLVDRHGQARVMRPALVVAAVGIAGLIVPALLHASPWFLYVAAVVSGAGAGSVGALVRARWSYVLSDVRALHTAYSLESAVDELVFIVGPVLATVLATGVHPTAGLVVPMVAVVVGGLWFFGQRATEPPPSRREPGVRHRHVLRSGGMVVLAVVFICMGAIFGATDVATVAFAEEQGSKGSAGLILAVFATGSMLSGLGYGARHWASPLWRRFAVGMVALAVGVCLFFLATSLVLLAGAMFVVGFAIAPTLINGNGLVQQFVPRAQLTEGLTWVGTSLGVGVSLGASSAGAAIDANGSHGGFLVVVVAAGAAVIATLASLRALQQGSADAERRLLDGVGAPDDDRIEPMAPDATTPGQTASDDAARAEAALDAVPDPATPHPGLPLDEVEHLVVMGVSGSGKSTIGQLLATELGRPFGEGDEFHPEENVAAMRAGIPLTDEHRAPWLVILRDWMTAEAQAGRSTVLACSALRRSYRDVLRGAEGRVRFVHLADEDSLIEARQAAREGHFMPASLMSSQRATLEPLAQDEDGVVVDVDQEPHRLVASILTALDARPSGAAPGTPVT